MTDQVYCPYCMQPAALQDVPFRCASGLKPECRMEVIPGSRRLEAVCPHCKHPTGRRACPNASCARDLPSGYCDQPNKIIALFGAIASGKSTYVTVLIRELRRWLTEERGAAMTPGDDETAAHYRDDMETPLYKDGLVLDRTPEMAPDVALAPLVYCLSVTDKGRFCRSSRRLVTLVFFDTAGEDMSDKAKRQKYGAYVAAASGVIFIVDPTEFDGARGDLMPAADRRRNPGATVGEKTVMEITRWFEEMNPGRKSRLTVPACLVLSKIDRLPPALSRDLVLHRVPEHRGVLDTRDREAVHDEVKALLRRWGSTLDEIEQRYHTVGFFAMSALGAAPNQERLSPTGVRPHRVADPLLWLLAEFGLVAKV